MIKKYKQHGKILGKLWKYDNDAHQAGLDASDNNLQNRLNANEALPKFT